MTDSGETIRRLAAECASELPVPTRSFLDDAPAFERDLAALIAAIRKTHARFDFDLEGRPAAVRAVRSALPVMEAELFDAVLEDVACELAAKLEALYRIAQAARADGRQSG